MAVKHHLCLARVNLECSDGCTIKLSCFRPKLIRRRHAWTRRAAVGNFQLRKPWATNPSRSALRQLRAIERV